jgi:hypothetical protein
MLLRQKILLALIEGEPGHTISRLKLVKLCFLLNREWPNAPAAAIYEFLPYKYGPFSFTLYQELDALCRNGDLQLHGEKDVGTVAGRPAIALESGAKQMLRFVNSRYGDLTLPCLIDTIYTKHPWFTLNSDRVEKRAATLPVVPCQIYTAGYGGMQVDGFLNLLLERGMRCLIDVRANPVSRKYGFHKSTLSRLCANVGLDYLHLPELGIPAAWRTELATPADYARLFARYEEEILPAPGAAQARQTALTALREKPSVLVCQEADPQSCHRLRLARCLARETRLPLEELRLP